MLLTEAKQNLRLDGLLTLAALTHRKLGEFMTSDRDPKQMTENVKKFDMEKFEASWTKIRDLRHTLIQYLLQQNRFGTGEHKTIQIVEDVGRYVESMPSYEHRSPSIDQRRQRVCDGDIRSGRDVRIP